MASLSVQAEFGYVVVVVVYSWAMLMVLARNVMVARKKYGVKYPDLYSKDSAIFNCVQRAHQNTLEGYPVWLGLLLVVGFTHPLISAACGFIWVTSRFSYAHGYSSGGQLNHSPTHLPTHPFTHPATHSPTHSPTHSLTYSLTHSPIHSPTHSPSHSLTYSPTYSPIHSPSHSLTYSFTYSLTHLTYSLTH
ncbi:glutathione S-transferase 3, mitochondrial-like, partial [Lampetra fluviatilis]